MTLELDGEEVKDGTMSMLAEAVKAFFDAIPEAERGRLMKAEQIGRKFKRTSNAINRLCGSLPEYNCWPVYVRGQRFRLWGHPDAIAELRKRGGVL